jgi:hypothetical protein
MKKSLTIIGLLAGAVGVYAQGTIQWSDYDAKTFSISVYSPNPAQPTAEQFGNGPTDVPAGSATFGGQLLGGSTTGTGLYSYSDGNDYTVGLYEAATSTGLTTALMGSPLATTSILTTSGGAGNWQYSALTAANSGIAPGGTAFVELAVWYNDGGAYTSYSTALANGVPTGTTGPSDTSVTLGGQGPSGPPATAPGLGGLGFTSFSLTSVPEPSTIALGVMGASAFLFRRRKA